MPTLTAETLTIHGPDAMAFAHTQLASDIHALTPASWQWSAWLNARGRVRCILQVVHQGSEELLLLLRGGKAQDMAEQLAPYVLRRRVSITAHAPRTLADAPPLPLHVAQTSGERLHLGMGNHTLCIGDLPAAAQAWRQAAIEAGQAWLPESALEAFTAPALGLDKLGAVSVDKGCYPGQEIVARLHHRGGNKRHLCLIQASDNLQPGQPLQAQGKSVGQILDAVACLDIGSTALAVVQGMPIPSRLDDDKLGPLQLLPVPN